MNRDEIKDIIKDIIIEDLSLKLNKSDINGSDLINELGINSVDALEIFVLIENTFKIQINDDDLSTELIASLDNLADYVMRKRKEVS